MVSISVIIVNYNAQFFLKNCIASILSSDIIDQIEIIVVDNASSDGSYNMIKDDFPEVHSIQNKENVGFGKANNQAASVAKGDYILVLNPDTMLAETTLSEMLIFCQKQSDFGAAGVQFIDGAGNFLPESKRNFPDLKVAGAKLLGFSKNYYANHIDKDSIEKVDILTGAFMFIKKEAYKRVGGFDEDFFMYGEDIDLSYRISKAGYSNHYLGAIKVLHFKGESTIKDRFYLHNFYGALSIFYNKHFPNNATAHAVIKNLVKMIISLKSFHLDVEEKPAKSFGKCAYIGNDMECLGKLKSKFPQAEFSVEQEVSDRLSDQEIMFFDPNFMSYKQIIKGIDDPVLKKVKKRIIDPGHTFYLGSDQAQSRGEAVNI